MLQELEGGLQWPEDTDIAVIDLDDTLWGTTGIYEAAIDYTMDQIERWNPGVHTREQLRKTIDEEDRARAQGPFSIERFPETLRDVAAAAAPRISKVALHRILQAGYSVFTTPAKLFPGAWDGVARLGKAGMVIVYYTHGDPVVQRLRYVYARLELAAPQSVFVVTSEKDVENLKRIVSTPEHTWVVGNSPRTDILPAHTIGLTHLWLVNAPSWSFEHHTFEDGYTPYYAPTFAQAVPQILRQRRMRVQQVDLVEAQAV